MSRQILCRGKIRWKLWDCGHDDDDDDISSITTVTLVQWFCVWAYLLTTPPFSNPHLSYFHAIIVNDFNSGNAWYIVINTLIYSTMIDLFIRKSRVREQGFFPSAILTKVMIPLEKGIYKRADLRANPSFVSSITVCRSVLNTSLSIEFKILWRSLLRAYVRYPAYLPFLPLAFWLSSVLNFPLSPWLQNYRTAQSDIHYNSPF